MVVMDEGCGGWFTSWKWFEIRRNVFVAKSCIGRERVWFSMGL